MHQELKLRAVSISMIFMINIFHLFKNSHTAICCAMGYNIRNWNNIHSEQEVINNWSLNFHVNENTSLQIWVIAKKMFITVPADALAINTLRPRQNGCHFADDTFKRIFLNENVWIPIKISLKFVPKSPINNIPALVQIMAWRCLGDKPLSEPMMVSLPTHICVTQPQWVNSVGHSQALMSNAPPLPIHWRYHTHTYLLTDIISMT